MKPSSFAHRANAALIDQYYENWRNNPEEVDANWRAFFEGFELARGTDGDLGPATERAGHKEPNVTRLVFAYRSLGHLAAHLNPLESPRPDHPKLLMEEYGLSESDLNETFSLNHFLDGKEMDLGGILAHLRETYCHTIGVEYHHIQDSVVRRWLRSRMEPVRNRPDFSPEKKRRILRKIHEAEMFEHFLHTRYAGQKRFSLEGAETLIAALDALMEKCPSCGVREVVMGMAHRGRLNVLANIMRKSYEFIFREFSENYIPNTVAGDGDVKYHLGYEASLPTESGEEVKLFLSANPSHLEAVDPVVQGRTRARQRLLNDLQRLQVLPLLIHGDAAFAGQGVVAEVLNYSQLPGYRTGGTLHIIINNQIGFTTLPQDGRSSPYCTDVAKMIEAPIFHVNGDDPAAVVMCVELALEFRQHFQRDVVIDMYCYRRYGHNETDEPMFTQPLLYRKIASHPPISRILCECLIDEGVLSKESSDQITGEFQAILEEAFEKVKKEEKGENRADKFEGSTAVFQPSYSFEPVQTAVTPELLEKAARGLTTVPDHLALNSKIRRQLEGRWKAFQHGGPIDWAAGEAFAFATLLLEGTPVRLSGQDSERGTFSHRHAVLYDIDTHERYVPLLNLAPGQARFCVYNSPLSEAGVLGFDFGYSLDYPKMLCLWEAQFGDFANGAQVIIDQFITSSESKWQRVSGIVLLLPHGYEGQGPEHSSARLERFLASCAEDNIEVCHLTTPAQYFHLLRRQMRRGFRKPLVLMSPKSLLRHREAVSPVKDFTSGGFGEILEDPHGPDEPERLILCSGKVYYDLHAHRTARGIENTAIVRIEQLYPLHKDKIAEAMTKADQVKDLVWCQEEPQNMGAWTFIAPRLEELGGRKPRYAGRDASASPAVGSLALHKLELQQFIESAFAG